MSYLAGFYGNFDAHFAEENPAMVSFSSSIEVGSVVFIGLPGSGKLSILGQLNDRFKVPPGSARIDSEVQSAEIRNVMFRIQIVDCPTACLETRPPQIFESCRVIIVVIDATKDHQTCLPLLEPLRQVHASLRINPAVHVFLNKVDLVEQPRAADVVAIHRSLVASVIPDAEVWQTSITDGSALFRVSKCIEDLLPKSDELKAAMEQFSSSLDLTNSFLVDLQSRVFLLSSGIDPLDPDAFSICQDGIEMFVGIATMMDARNSPALASVRLKDGTFLHFFWSAFDVILAGIAAHRLPAATAKNNAYALLHTIKRALE
jgi:hypothetical protein